MKKTHKGVVDVIYIDPPYNTGNKFVYNDNRTKKNEWKEFMRSRLQKAKGLLKETGVIFVSIDHHEFANLKLLLEEIFGIENYITEFIWEKHPSGSSLAQFVRNTTEYILLFAKDKNKTPLPLFHSYVKGEAENDIYHSSNKERVLVFPREKVFFKQQDTQTIPKGVYGKQEIIEDITLTEEGVSIDNIKIKARFKWTQEYLDEKIQEGYTFVIKGKNNYIYYVKNDLSVMPPKDFLSSKDIDIGTTSKGRREIEEILGGNTFSYPKPTGLIKYLINMVTYNNKEALVLDFFAGSGTTGHAVMQLNNEDKGKRQFILCTNNEVSEEKLINYLYQQGKIDKPTKTELNKFSKENSEEMSKFKKSNEYQELGIARAITQPRIRRVIEGYTTPKGKKVKGIENNSVSYYIVKYRKEGVKKEH